MPKTISRLTLVLLCTIALLATMYSAQKQSIREKDVPKVVLETFQKSYTQAAIKGYSKEVKRGNVVYEIESVENEVHRHVAYTPDGSLISIEESLPFADLPEAVRKTIMGVFPKGNVSLCEIIIKGSTIQFEVLVTSRGQKYELAINPDGHLATVKRK